MKELDVKKGEIVNELFWTSNEQMIKSYRCRACSYGTTNFDKSRSKLYSVHIPKAMKTKQKSPLFLVKWDSRLLPERKAILDTSDTPSCLAVSLDGNFVGIGCLGGTVMIYISFSLKCVKRVENAHSSFITGLTFAPVTFADQTGSVMQSRLFSDFDAVLLSISIDKQVNCVTVPQRTTLSVGFALLLCILMVMLVGLGIAFGASL